MLIFNYVIKDQIGLHARPATLLVNLVKSVNSTVTVEKEGKTADAEKLLALMGLAITQGDEVKVIIEGEDEKEAEKKLQNFFQKNL